MMIIQSFIIDAVENNNLLIGLFIVIMFDILSGICKAIKEKRVNSSIGLIGLLKHSLIIVTTLTIVIVLPIFELGSISQSLVIFYIIQYGFSIVENFIRIGVPVPKFLYNILLEKNKDYERVVEDEI